MAEFSTQIEYKALPPPSERILVSHVTAPYLISGYWEIEVTFHSHVHIV